MRKFSAAAAQNIAEHLMVLLFGYGAFVALTAPPAPRGGVLVNVFGGEWALIIYGLWFGGLAAWLLYAKWRSKKKQHKFALFGMFLAAIYTITLVTALVGFDVANLWDNTIAAVVTGALWLRWKLVTEYIDPRAFAKAVESERKDLPPPPPP